MLQDTARFLLTEPGRDLLTWIAEQEETDPARLLARARRSATAEQAAAAWEVASARRRADAKFGDSAAEMFFTTEALEQASSAGAARYHAQRLASAGIDFVVDLCGGIGADAIAFARAGIRVLQYEVDPVRAMFAAENALVSGFEDRIAIRCADVTTGLDLTVVDHGKRVAAWFDPARRVGNRRVADPENYLPPLSLVNGLRTHGLTTVGVKLSPAVDHSVATTYSAELEFLSDDGECKEALLWTGGLTTGTAVSATVLRDGVTHTLRGNSDPTRLHTATWSVGYLYEPDPAVIRAHLVRELGSRLGAVTLDPHIAYLIGQHLVSTPFATPYRVLDRFPYHLRTLQRALKERNVGRVIIKKRGFPQEPDEIRKQLKLSGEAEITVVLTRIGVQHQALLCEPCRPVSTGKE
jgi:hypothetical protein